MTDINLTSNERVAFERWAESEGFSIERRPAPFANSEDRNGHYFDDHTYNMAKAWEAAGRAHETNGLPVAQEPEYTIRNGRLVNRASGEDEPVFVFRAKDR
jgi:hypothetical protein